MKRRINAILAGMIAVLASASSDTQESRSSSLPWLPVTYPRPDQSACRSGTFTRLCDPDSILGEIESLGKVLESNRSIKCKTDNVEVPVQFAVALLQKVLYVLCYCTTNPSYAAGAYTCFLLLFFLFHF